MSRQEIANALEQFYLTARRPNGTQYKKNTLKSIKHSLDLYLRSSPLKKDFSISSDFDFRQVNRTLDNLPEDADNNRFPQCTRETILKLYKTGQLGLVTSEDPQVLIQTVWFYIASHFFSNIDKRMLRELTGSMLVLSKDESGKDYYWLDYKTPDRCRSDVRKTRIYAKTGSICCPVAIIKKYLEHRNPRNEVLFQHPKKISSTIWYSHLPLGKNKHMDIIKVMCVNAGIDPPLTGRCIRSYVQELLRDVDQVVNDMFRVGAIATLPTMTLQTVILPKVPGNGEQPPVDQIAHSVSHFPLNGQTSFSCSRISSENSAGAQLADHVTEGHGGTPTTDVATSSGFINGVQSSGIIIPNYRNNFLSVNGFDKAQPLESSDSFQGTQGSPGESAITSKMLGIVPQYGHINSDQGTAVVEVKKIQGDVPTSTETATQTDKPGDCEWSQSAYNKADLKTKNKMRLQARKSLLSFLEELNEISDGHGTELFHEIVQEDMNMWRSIAGPVISK